MPLRFKNIFAFCLFLGMESVLVGLGVWQWQRLYVKKELIAQMQQAKGTPAVLLNEGGIAYRKARIKGQFQQRGNAYAVVLMPLSPRGGKLGYGLMAPLSFVDRNTHRKQWIWARLFLEPTPQQAKEKFLKQADGGKMLEVQGILRPGYKKTHGVWGVAMHSRGVWLKPFLKEMSVHAQLPEAAVSPLWLDTLPQAEEEVFLPVSNRHFEYMVTWWALAVILLVIYSLRFL